MEYEDTITIATPEGIELEYTLAGAGSRFIAGLVDVALRLLVLAAIILILALIHSGTLSVIVISISSLLAWFAYDVVFEVWGGGRTPGKRWSGLRVVTAGGAPVSVGPSAVRTLLRLIDVWATLSILGMLCIMGTRQNQRLGDLAAGTVVIREPRGQAAAGAVEVPSVDAVDDASRARVADALAGRLSDKVGGVIPGSVSSEHILELVLAAKSRAGSEVR
jgi:uncharacterized RDD family membrane protein YckC